MGYIIDVTVRYEDEGTMAEAAADKIGIYYQLRPVVSRLHPEVGDVIVVPVVLGGRGCVPADTRGALQHFGFTANKIRALSLRILRSAISISGSFLENV
jgi:hypothetical protein